MTIETINPTEFEWQIIINPYALSLQNNSYKTQIEVELQRIGINYKKHLADDGHGTCREQICRLCQAGERHFIVCGGDGTINEIINGIFQSGVNTREVYVAILPMGTGNDFCRTHLYPNDLQETLHCLAHPSFIQHDVGLVRSINGNGTIAERYFINIAGFGFDADVIQHTVGNKPKHFSSAIYLTTLLKVLFKHKSQNIHIKGDNFDITENVYTMAVGIGKYNGNGMMQVPMALQDNGLLDLVVIRHISPFKVIANVKNLYAGKHLKMKEVSTYKTQHISIRSSEHVLGEVEGEMLKQGDYDISVLPRSVNIMTMQQNNL